MPKRTQKRKILTFIILEVFYWIFSLIYDIQSYTLQNIIFLPLLLLWDRFKWYSSIPKLYQNQAYKTLNTQKLNE